MRSGQWSPPGIDPNVPSVARMYDFLLDGRDNYQADRDACVELLKVVPSMKDLALNNRQFLRRVVHYLAAGQGVTQFIDHGSGLPTRDNVHQVAQRINPASAVVYVDNDPIVLAHGRALLGGDKNTAVIQADMRDTDSIFGHEETRRLIDFDQPVAALFVSVLHCIPDQDDPASLIRDVASRLAPGSFLVVCQLVSADAHVRTSVTDFMDQATQHHWGRVREHHEVTAYFDGLDIIDPPGLREVSTWMPDNDLVRPQRTFEWEEWGGVAQVPGPGRAD
ncbi:SAM-dependent methyltransferase [Streptomyces sp. NPDC006692]|uniref:SAM-dependent methyltransferase n=1 Tax=unclassified Streptomyces TaxID=2593676 RepID=UPI0036A0117D